MDGGRGWRAKGDAPHRGEAGVADGDVAPHKGADGGGVPYRLCCNGGASTKIVK